MQLLNLGGRVANIFRNFESMLGYFLRKYSISIHIPKTRWTIPMIIKMNLKYWCGSGSVITVIDGLLPLLSSLVFSFNTSLQRNISKKVIEWLCSFCNECSDTCFELLEGPYTNTIVNRSIEKYTLFLYINIIKCMMIT